MYIQNPYSIMQLIGDKKRPFLLGASSKPFLLNKSPSHQVVWNCHSIPSFFDHTKIDYGGQSILANTYFVSSPYNSIHVCRELFIYNNSVGV